MAQPFPEGRHTSRWSIAAAILFVAATIAFVVMWFTRHSSGIEQTLWRAAALTICAAAWISGVASLGLGALQAHRQGWTPRLPPFALGLAFFAAVCPLWIAYGRANPERLVRSAERGDVAWVERCLRRGVDVDARYEELLGFGGRQPSPSALGAASMAGQLEVVEILIGARADLDAPDSARRTPCEAAILAGHVKIVARLLAAGATLVRDDDAAAPIATLLRAGDSPSYPLEDLLTLLVENGADPGPVSLLLQAMWLKSPRAARALVDLLQDASAEVSPASRLLQALVVDARDEEDSELLQLYGQARGGAELPDDVELLQLAAKFAHPALVSRLVERGVPVDAERLATTGPLTALHYAVVGGHAKTVELLLRLGADPARRAGTWGTALHRACSADRPEIAALLVRAGVDLEAPRAEGIPEPPLFSCIYSDSLEIARLLLEAGARADARNAQGQTPGEEAHRRGRQELAQLFESWSAR